MDMQRKRIRQKRDTLYRRIHELQAEMDGVENSLRQLQRECQHANAKYGSCPDCDKEIVDEE